jgi:hypothetical protein
MTTALPPKDNQQLPTDLPKRASYPAGVPATGERPGHQTGSSSSRGVRRVPRRLAARAPWERASTPLGVVQSPRDCARAALTPGSTSTAAQARQADGPAGIRVAPPGCREPFGLLPTKRRITEDEPHPPDQLGAVAARCKHRRSRRPCHPRAISSGQWRYPAVNHGHFEEAGGLGACL